ncbi:Fibronectin type III [Trinorchestia longiramus]|nr:Fibronectin type III [Trinorchestia longiramus]
MLYKDFNINTGTSRWCNGYCKTKLVSFQCLTGCQRWVAALNSSCSSVCSLEDAWSADDTHGLYCSLGCSYGALNYVALVHVAAMLPCTQREVARHLFHLELMATPPEPTLVGGSLGSSSVGLRWPSLNALGLSKSGSTFQSMLPLSPVVQLRPHGLHWRSHANTTWVLKNEVLLQGLHPYTKYQFRVAWVAVPGQDALLSRPSSWISTLPAGPPLSPPADTRVRPLDGSRIEARWSAPEIPAGELVSYTVSLKVLSTGEQLRKDVSPSIHRYVVTGLQGNTSYEVGVAAVNKEGHGPAAVSVVSTYPNSNDIQKVNSNALLHWPPESGSGGYLLMASGVSLLRLGLDIMKPPSFLYNTSDHSVIKGLALHIRRGLLYVSDSSGRIMRLSPATHERRIIELSQHMRGGGASTLSVDWLNNFLYILEDPHLGQRDNSAVSDSASQSSVNSADRPLSHDRSWKESLLNFGKPGSHTSVVGSTFNFNTENTEAIKRKKAWNIWRADLQGENLELVAELNYPVERIQVDPYNGFLWWVRPGRRGGLYRLDVGANLRHGKRPTRLLTDGSLSGLVVDLQNFRILVACRNNNSMMAVSLDGTLVEDARYNTQQAYFREARDAVLLHGRLYWTGPSEVYTEEVNGGTYYHNRTFVLSFLPGRPPHHSPRQRSDGYVPYDYRRDPQKKASKPWCPQQPPVL